MNDDAEMRKLATLLAVALPLPPEYLAAEARLVERIEARQSEHAEAWAEIIQLAQNLDR